jgi:diguanylate cyclase (GGDEF)-like protein/PAS domain S-box-containing protein
MPVNPSSPRPFVEASADRWGAALDALPVAIFETDATGRGRFVNRGPQTTSGLTGEPTDDRGWIDAIHPADRDLVATAWQAAVRDETDFALEFRVLGPDGATIWAAGQAAAMRATDGSVTGYLGTITDVTALVDERHVQIEERRFVDAILEVAGALVCVFDGDGRILRFNQACELVTGYSFEEVRGRPFYDFLVPPAEIEAVRADLTALRPGQPPMRNENNWVTRDGRLRLIAWSDVCFFDDDGRATHLISTGIDITDERRGEDAMRGIEAVGILLAKTGPTRESMAAVLAILSDRMGYPRLSLVVRRGSRFELGAQVGRDAGAEPFDPTRGLVGRVLETAQPARSGTTRIAVPLTADGETVGVLAIESTPGTPLTGADLRLIDTVAERLSVALVLFREQHALTERARLFSALNGFAQAVGAMVDAQLLVMALLDRIAAVVPHDASTLTLLYRDTNRYLVRAVRGGGFPSEALGQEVVSGHGPAGRSIAGRTLITERLDAGDPSDDEPAPMTTSGALVSIPLIHDDVVLGTIVIARTGPAAEFSDVECEVLTLIGAQAGLAAANAHLLAEVHALAIRDPLTGLFNRRHFDASVEHIVARWKRDRAGARPIAAIMFDLDRFGDLNNAFGHQAGDAVLREFAGLLLSRFRSADLVARYGGEEFVVVMEGATLADAAAVAEEIRLELEACVVAGPDGQEVRATVSAGCAAIDATHPTREALIEAADVALFTAKRAGRNRVIAGGPGAKAA